MRYEISHHGRFCGQPVASCSRGPRRHARTAPPIRAGAQGRLCGIATARFVATADMPNWMAVGDEAILMEAFRKPMDLPLADRAPRFPDKAFPLANSGCGLFRPRRIRRSMPELPKSNIAAPSLRKSRAAHCGLRAAQPSHFCRDDSARQGCGRRHRPSGTPRQALCCCLLHSARIRCLLWTRLVRPVRWPGALPAGMNALPGLGSISK